MKKLLVLVLTCIGLSTMASVVDLPFIGQGFPSSFGGLIYSNATRAAYKEQAVDLGKFEVLGKVTVHANMENVLLIVNWGDTSLATLKAKAKNIYPQADDFVNIEIDVTHKNIFVFYMQDTVEMRAVAIKYKK